MGAALIESSSASAERTATAARRGDVLYRSFGNTGQTVSVLVSVVRISEKPLPIASRRRSSAPPSIAASTSWTTPGTITTVTARRDGYRQKVFLMTKVDGRTKETAAKQLDESLKRFQTDHVDLLQFHAVIRMEDSDRFFAPRGALEAFLDARKAGKIRFIGFTGHKDPLIHLRVLDMAREHNFRFDAVLFSSNVMDWSFRSFIHQVMPVALRDGIALQTMKPWARSSFSKAKWFRRLSACSTH